VTDRPQPDFAVVERFIEETSADMRNDREKDAFFRLFPEFARKEAVGRTAERLREIWDYLDTYPHPIPDLFAGSIYLALAAAGVSKEQAAQQTGFGSADGFEQALHALMMGRPTSPWVN